MKESTEKTNEIRDGEVNKVQSIAIIDAGPTSSALIELLKQRMPESKRNLVTAVTLKKAQGISINPFDIDLLTTRIDGKQFNLK